MKNYHFKIFDHKNEQLWDEFVQGSINGTIFHERNFINYHPKERFDDHSLMIYEGEKLVALFPAALIEKNNKLILKSHPGTSYGGLVFKRNLRLEEFDQILKDLIMYSIREEIDLIEFREGPKIFNKYPIDQFDFALLNNGFIRESEELSSCYFLDDFRNKDQDELIEFFNNATKTKARQGIKKAIKNNCEFSFIDDRVDEFYEILKSNLVKHSTNPVHSSDEIKDLLKRYPERVKLAGTLINNKIIAGMLLFNINNKGWHIFYSALDYDSVEHRPVHFLIFSLLKDFSQTDWEYLNYGISTEDGGNVINWDLFRFKESFNSHGILRTYWQKEL